MSQPELTVLVPAILKSARRRSKLSLRAAAAKCGVSAATLSRLERGEFTTLPDSATLQRLATWLEISMDALLNTKQAGTKPVEMPDTPDLVEAQLLRDARLSKPDAQALATMFRQLYANVAHKGGRAR